ARLLRDRHRYRLAGSHSKSARAQAGDHAPAKDTGRYVNEAGAWPDLSHTGRSALRRARLRAGGVLIGPVLLLARRIAGRTGLTGLGGGRRIGRGIGACRRRTEQQACCGGERQKPELHVWSPQNGISHSVETHPPARCSTAALIAWSQRGVSTITIWR